MKTLRNGLRVLRALAEAEEPIGVVELSRQLGIDKATAYRMLATFVDEGFAEQETRTRRYSLGLGVVDLATSRLRDTSLANSALPVMEALRDQLNETVALMVPDGRRLACALTCESRQMVRVTFFIGERVPIHNTAAGTAFLGALPQEDRIPILASLRNQEQISEAELDVLLADMTAAEERGYAVTRSRYKPGLTGLATAVRGDGGKILALLTVAAQTDDMPAERADETGKLLLQAAERIGTDIRAGRPPSIRHLI